ncbi:MAG: copper chaperone PCu(A)C [Sulfitobacter sp.]
MTFSRLLTAGAAALMMAATPLFAADIAIKDPYMRTSTPSSVTGAAFLMLMNASDKDDRLIAASTDIAGRVELHTHKEDANGVMQMMEVEEGFVIPAGGMHHLKRGGDHIMLMGLTRPLEQGEEIEVTLTFEEAGEVTVQIPVDRERKPDHGAMNHSNDS